MWTTVSDKGDEAGTQWVVKLELQWRTHLGADVDLGHCPAVPRGSAQHALTCGGVRRVRALEVISHQRDGLWLQRSQVIPHALENPYHVAVRRMSRKQRQRERVLHLAEVQIFGMIRGAGRSLDGRKGASHAIQVVCNTASDRALSHSPWRPEVRWDTRAVQTPMQHSVCAGHEARHSRPISRARAW